MAVKSLDSKVKKIKLITIAAFQHWLHGIWINLSVFLLL